jgi:modulator of FtsH protease
MYAPDRWHEFYVMVGGASAALTGLIFVAISIHLRSVLATPFFRARARYLTGCLVLVLVTSALVLVPEQSQEAVGAELIVVGVITSVAFAAPVLRLARIAERSDVDVRVRQAVAWVGLALWVLSGISLIIGHGGGLFILLVGVIIVLNVSVGGAWSLLTGSEAQAELQDARSAHRKPRSGPDSSGIPAAKRHPPTGRPDA